MKKPHLLLLLALAASMQSSRVHGQVLVIANPKVEAAEISKVELRDIFTGASSSLRGRDQVTPVLLRQGPVNDGFLDLYVGKSDSAFRAYWRSLVFSGQGVMPRSLESEAAMVDYVAHTAGAVGYVSKAAVHEGVKTLGVR